MITIKEVIVVEGRDDETAVKMAVNAEIIITHGYGIREETFKRIEKAQERCGVIIFTDPDFAGEQIRNRIADRVFGCKHAFLPRAEGTKDGDIGIENASSESIINALSKVRTVIAKERDEFSRNDLIIHGLVGSSDATVRRDRLGKLLGIGYANGKQFLKRLNRYDITREEFEESLKVLD